MMTARVLAPRLSRVADQLRQLKQTMSQVTQRLGVAINDEKAGRISRDQLLGIFQEAIDNGDISTEDNQFYFVAFVLPLIDAGLLRPSEYTNALERELAESARNLAHKTRNELRQPDGSDPSSVEAVPGYPDYFLPAGIGLAYGIFETGFVTHWAIEAVVFSLLWGMRASLLKSWTYRAYSVERKKLGLDPDPVVFTVLQTATTAIFVLAIALLVAGAKRLLGYDAP